MPEKPIENDLDRQIDVESLWALAMNLCVKDPDQRPTISVIVTRIQGNPNRAIASPASDFNVDPSSSNERNSVYVWHDHTHVECIGPLPGHTSAVSCVAFSPDSSKLASGSSDGSIRLWDAITGVDLFGRLKRISGRILSVAFSPDGSKVISGSMAPDICIWDAKTGALIDTFARTDETPSLARYSSDGSRIFVTSLSPPAVHTIDVQIGTVLSTSSLPLRPPSSVQVISHTSDASQVACYYSDGFICVQDAFETRIAGRRHLQVGEFTSLAYSPDGSKLAAGSSHGLDLFDARTLGLITHLDQPYGRVAFSPDGSRVISGVRGSFVVRLWDSSNGVPISCDLVGHTKAGVTVAISPDGSRIASGSFDKSVRIWVGTDGP